MVKIGLARHKKGLRKVNIRLRNSKFCNSPIIQGIPCISSFFARGLSWVVHAFNTSTPEAEAGRFLWVLG